MSARYSPYPLVQAWVEAIRDHPDLGVEEYALARVSARFMDSRGRMRGVEETTLDAAFDLELAELQREARP